MADERSDNYYRLITLIVKTGTKTLNRVLIKHIGGGDLSPVLAKHKSTFEQLRDKRKVTEIQYQLITASEPDPSKFDISLLVVLIRVCTSVQPPVGGWDTRMVTHSDRSIGGAIYQIRDVRNAILHAPDTCVCNETFKGHWSTVESCVTALAGDVSNTFKEEMEKEIKTIISMHIVSEECKKLEATLEKWEVEDLYKRLTVVYEKTQTQMQKQQSEMQIVSKELADIRERLGDRQQTGGNRSDTQTTTFQRVNEEINNVRDIMENQYMNNPTVIRTGHTGPRQDTEPLPPITNPNALTETEIIQYSLEVEPGNWKTFAIYLGYKDHQTQALELLFPQQIQERIRKLVQEWHDVVARCDKDTNPKMLLAAAFAQTGNNRVAAVILGDKTKVKEVRGTRPSPGTEVKIQDISFDMPRQPPIELHVIHYLGRPFSMGINQPEQSIAGATKAIQY